MDLVTITDHDQIAGALALAGRPDTFVSEEVTLALEGGRQLHIGVFDITEKQHERLQAIRRDPPALFAYLDEQRIPACLNHPFAAMTGPREAADLLMAFRRLRLVEALNGAMPADSNARARVATLGRGLSAVGGSDAHALAFVARSYTVVPGARSKEEFLAGLRAGLTVAGGRSGSYSRLAAEMAGVFVAALRDEARPSRVRAQGAGPLLGTLLLMPLVPIVPLASLVLHGRERAFARRQFCRFEAAGGLQDAARGVRGHLREPIESLG
jgi:hypothetical protein